jgi:flavin reductase (DIM6/NTAB) family NADH-FMN oxidoreductase RutF
MSVMTTPEAVTIHPGTPASSLWPGSPVPGARSGPGAPLPGPLAEAGETVTAEAFRAVMAAVCTPVAVVTTMTEERPHGTTVSAFTSLSLNPPMVVISLDESSELLRQLRQSRRFGLNVLSSAQSWIARRFATKGDDKFQGVPWRMDGGQPRITGSAGWIVAEVENLVTGGDHTLLLGRVAAADHVLAEPLTYHRRVFGTHVAISEVRA